GRRTEAFPTDRPVIGIWTKCDLAVAALLPEGSTSRLPTSAATGIGLDELRQAIARIIRSRDSDGNLPAGTAARCRGSIMRAEAALCSGAKTIIEGGGDELVAFDLRLAVEELGKVVGEVVTDDILERIFSRFCIGK